MSQASNGDLQLLNQLTDEWASAELRGNLSFLDQTLTSDFIGIGPRIFRHNSARP